jgi:hypothetical protein
MLLKKIHQFGTGNVVAPVLLLRHLHELTENSVAHEDNVEWLWEFFRAFSRNNSGKLGPTLNALFPEHEEFIGLHDYNVIHGLM